ncbi:hypothetical protein PRUPE_5G187300 [Prunus persica]|uniref:Uncharacterized protein n=1 Tax=Prunus persica TaxID=3760 RepID=M5WY45_PRUPE|nr:hypothetical protein PRUPE_5G187300 [Prunus persica]
MTGFVQNVLRLADVAQITLALFFELLARFLLFFEVFIKFLLLPRNDFNVGEKQYLFHVRNQKAGLIINYNLSNFPDIPIERNRKIRIFSHVSCHLLHLLSD